MTSLALFEFYLVGFLVAFPIVALVYYISKK